MEIEWAHMMVSLMVGSICLMESRVISLHMREDRTFKKRTDYGRTISRDPEQVFLLFPC